MNGHAKKRENKYINNKLIIKKKKKKETERERQRERERERKEKNRRKRGSFHLLGQCDWYEASPTLTGHRHCAPATQII